MILTKKGRGATNAPNNLFLSVTIVIIQVFVTLSTIFIDLANWYNEVVEYMSTAEAAEKLGLHQNTMRQHLKRGVIKGVKVGAIWLIHEDEIARYERERKPPGRPKG